VKGAKTRIPCPNGVLTPFTFRSGYVNVGCDEDGDKR